MDKVVSFVDSTMLSNLTTYIIGKRGSTGSFIQTTNDLDKSGRAPTNITNAYIVWTLT